VTRKRQRVPIGVTAQRVGQIYGVLMDMEYHSFIQVGDIHVGECRSLANYLARHESVLTQIMDTAYNYGLPLVITGDITNSKSTTYEERFLIDWWFSEIEKRKIPTVVITGNHDHLWGEVTQLDGLKMMPFKYVKIVTWHPDICVLGNIGVICIPWRGYKTEEINKIVSEKIPLLSNCEYRVVMLHECIAGMKADSGKIIPTGTAIPNVPEIDYWAVGDIHKFQMTNVSNGYYSGAPAQYKFDDTLPKGLLRVDLKHPSKEPVLIPLMFKPLKTVSSVEEITEDAYYRIVGNYEEIIKANNDPMVVKTEYDDSQERTIVYERVGICEGLPEFLANKGINEDTQQRAVAWVTDLLK